MQAKANSIWFNDQMLASVGIAVCALLSLSSVSGARTFAIAFGAFRFLVEADGDDEAKVRYCQKR